MVQIQRTSGKTSEPMKLVMSESTNPLRTFDKPWKSMAALPKIKTSDFYGQSSAKKMAKNASTKLLLDSQVKVNIGKSSRD